ncbi:MAG: response regulator [Candidatus Marinimicrobia bacterium]|nr:response regulator [Candidatus Neomarinimicrobiota bacterium]MCF7829652.1 response regulator [Candidatus Neomarinimicrobiota bacterium]MCF7879812.1 response regulator [Candidatus Neomarinimicrobiota bacterium]
MAKQKLLIVDDEPNIRLTVTRALESLGVETDTAASGEEALKKVEAGDFQAVLLDLKIPKPDGLEVLRRLRQEQLDIPVVMISAFGSIDTAVEALNLGAVDFLQKPFSPTEIREAVQQALRGKESEPWTKEQYMDNLREAASLLKSHQLDKAERLIKQALIALPDKPNAYNVLGVLLEYRHLNEEAKKLYRAALGVDQSFTPASKNLDRLSSNVSSGQLNMGV